jgi:tetratricopeptide (TPR) repeat protein
MAPPSGPPGEISLDEPGAEPAEAVSVPGGSSAKALQLKHQGKYDAAAAEYRAVLKADPDDAEANWGLAWILAEQGVNTPKQRDARAYFARFLTVSDNVGRSAMAEAALKRIK